ncbi:hypothetical protein [Hydrotalea sp.]|uniref:hypothetical protein n=1 Tax=Hydrotalea sp. TaxID=2881279 RepID=UPI003D10F17C
MIIYILLLLYSCNNQSQQIKAIDLDTIANTIPTDEAQQVQPSVFDRVAALKKLTPFSPAQLKSILPKQLLQYHQTNFEITNQNGYSTAKFTFYNTNQNKAFQLTVIDCAGETGANIYYLQYLTRLNIQSETNDGYTKQFDLFGQKAIASYQKKLNQHELTFFNNERLLIQMSAKHIDIHEMKQIISALEFCIPS